MVFWGNILLLNTYKQNSSLLSLDYSKGFGGKYGVDKDKVDKSAVGFEYQGKTEKHESQKGFYYLISKILVQINQPFKPGEKYFVWDFFCSKCVFALCVCRFLFPLNEKEGIVNCPWVLQSDFQGTLCPYGCYWNKCVIAQIYGIQRHYQVLCYFYIYVSRIYTCVLHSFRWKVHQILQISEYYWVCTL